MGSLGNETKSLGELPTSYPVTHPPPEFPGNPFCPSAASGRGLLEGYRFCQFVGVSSTRDCHTKL